MATRVFESAVISSNIDQVWRVIRGLDFSFLSSVASVSASGDEVGSVHTFTYKDGTVQKVKLTEQSDATHTISYELIESIPHISVMSAVHTISLRRVSHDNTTLIEWTSDFSRDASHDVTADSKFKKLEFFKDLREALSRGCGKESKESKAYTGVPGTRHERTFLAVKPDGVQRALVGEIIARFERRGFQLVGMKFLTPTKAQAEGHYAEHKARPFFPGLVNFFSSGPIVAMVWQGEKVIDMSRQLVGKTKPWESAPGTIRGDFAVTTGRNIIHGSDGPESAQREIGFWFKSSEVFDWQVSATPHVYE